MNVKCISFVLLAHRLMHLKIKMARSKIFVLSLRNPAPPLTNHTNLLVPNAFKLYFDFCYFLFLSPFRLKWNSKTKEFIPVCFLPQKIICLIVSLVFLAKELLILIASYPKNTKRATQIFKFLEKLFSLVLEIFILKAFWFHQPHIAQVLNYITHIRLTFLSCPWQKIIFSRKFQTLLLTGKLSLLIFNFSGIFRQANWQIEIIAETRALLSFTASNPLTSCSQITKNVQNFSASEHVLIVVGCIISFLFIFYTYFIVDFLYWLAVALLSGVSSFTRNVQKSSKNSWEDTNTFYLAILCLATKLNQTITSIPLWWLATAIFYFANYVDTIFKSPRLTNEFQLASIFNLIYWLAMDFLFACSCGEICSKVYYLKI